VKKPIPLVQNKKFPTRLTFDSGCGSIEVKEIKMKLMTKEIQKKFETKPIGSGESLGLNAEVVVKFFTPWSNWTWYATEFDGKDEFFGLVDGFEKELGYFYLSELESLSGPFGMKIERDLHFGNKKLSELY
jgi:hypothetical protein